MITKAERSAVRDAADAPILKEAERVADAAINAAPLDAEEIRVDMRTVDGLNWRIAHLLLDKYRPEYPGSEWAGPVLGERPHTLVLRERQVVPTYTGSAER